MKIALYRKRITVDTLVSYFCYLLPTLLYFRIYFEFTGFGEGEGPDLISDTPPVPPRRREKKRHTPPRPVSNGLPPTPKVHMGACFSKVS